MLTTKRRIYEGRNGKLSVIQSCARCPLLDECEECEAPRRIRGRRPLINAACRLPIKPAGRLAAAKKATAPKPAPAKGGSGSLAAVMAKPETGICGWCGHPYGPGTKSMVIVGDRVLKVWGHEACMRQDIRSDSN